MSSYDTIRHFADSYGLAAMVVVFLTFAIWVFRPGSRHHYQDDATMIFAEDESERQQPAEKEKSHG